MLTFRRRWFTDVAVGAHEQYKGRNVVEGCFNCLKQFRAIATRFDKPAVRYRSGLHLVSLILRLRDTTA